MGTAWGSENIYIPIWLDLLCQGGNKKWGGEK